MSEQQYCPSCGSVGTATRRQKGTFLTEVGLWMLFLIPGLIYSIWRMTTSAMVCRACGNPGMIPLNSPIARAALDKSIR